LSHLPKCAEKKILGFLVEDVLHGSSLLVAQLEALLSARVKSRRSIGATEIAADGKADSVDVLLLAGGSSTVSQSLLKLVGETTRGMVLHVVGLLLDWYTGTGTLVDEILVGRWVGRHFWMICCGNDDGMFRRVSCCCRCRRQVRQSFAGRVMSRGSRQKSEANGRCLRRVPSFVARRGNDISTNDACHLPCVLIHGC
ncbi:hypothetical protein KCU74_g125, partial [Aureobasidium melanogenum]